MEGRPAASGRSAPRSARGPWPRGARRLAVAAACAAVVGCGGRSSLGAQTAGAPEGTTLARVEAMADAGRLEEARRELDAWFAGEEAGAARHEAVRARFLRARLSRDADSAEVEYLWVAIEGGVAYGAAAWLRLAQLHLARGEPGRARQELDRLRADYPASELDATSWLWSGRALEALGDLEAACEAWRRAAREGARRPREGEGVAALAEATRREACDRRALRYAVQLGAFRSRDGAEQVVRRASSRGFDPRVERRDGMHKVRVGRFSSIESAREMAERLRGAGFSAVIVSGDD